MELTELIWDALRFNISEGYFPVNLPASGSGLSRIAVFIFNHFVSAHIDCNVYYFKPLIRYIH